MATLERQQPSNAAITVIILVSALAVASVTMPRTDPGSPVWDLVDDHIVPMAVLAALVWDRPDATADPRRSEHHGAVPAVISVEAGTRSALMKLIRAASFPAFLTGTSRLANGLALRGPPFTLPT